MVRTVYGGQEGKGSEPVDAEKGSLVQFLLPSTGAAGRQQTPYRCRSRNQEVLGEHLAVLAHRHSRPYPSALRVVRDNSLW
jgi:hypothetical protein